jgi:hypothetical protein
MDAIVSYAINPSSFSSSNAVVHSITIQFALEAIDKEAACTKIAGSGLDFESPPLNMRKIATT